MCGRRTFLVVLLVIGVRYKHVPAKRPSRAVRPAAGMGSHLLRVKDRNLLPSRSFERSAKYLSAGDVPDFSCPSGLRLAGLWHADLQNSWCWWAFCHCGNSIFFCGPANVLLPAEGPKLVLERRTRRMSYAQISVCTFFAIRAAGGIGSVYCNLGAVGHGWGVRLTHQFSVGQHPEFPLFGKTVHHKNSELFFPGES